MPPKSQDARVVESAENTSTGTDWHWVRHWVNTGWHWVKLQLKFTHGTSENLDFH